MKFVWRLPESVLAVENRVRPGRRRCFVCTAPSAAAVARESCTFLDSAAVQNCRFWGEKCQNWSQSQVVGCGRGEAGCHRDAESKAQVHSHATIRAKLK